MKKSGFTLIELIFVIVIIGLLAAVAVPKFMSAKKKAEVANLSEVGHQIATKANEQYSIAGQANLKQILNEDSDINNYLGDINGSGIFSYDLNETQFDVNYTEGDANHLCLKVERRLDTIRVSKDRNITAYNFLVSEINTSCNQK